MVDAFKRAALIVALTVAPGAALADDGGFWPSWLTPPWTGGQPAWQKSPRSAAGVQPGGKESEKLIKLPAGPDEVDCPPVDIFDGGATARVGGADSQSVRYQFDITDTARQCLPQGGQFQLTVGVAGRLLIGPAGSPGAFSTTLHVKVKDEQSGKIVFQKNYSVAANTQGSAQAPFRLVTDPVSLPLTRARLDQDYSIEVGLGGGGGSPTPHRRKRHRG